MLRLASIFFVILFSASYAKASDFRFEVISFPNIYNSVSFSPKGRQLSLEGCHSLAKGGIECQFKYSDYISFFISGASEGDPAKSISLLGSVNKDVPKTVSDLMLSIGTVIAASNPYTSQEERNDLMKYLINNVSSETSAERRLGNVNYSASLPLGMWLFTAKVEP